MMRAFSGLAGNSGSGVFCRDGAEIDSFYAIANEFVIGTVVMSDASTDHVELVMQTNIHDRLTRELVCERQGKNGYYGHSDACARKRTNGIDARGHFLCVREMIS
jgi:hypothetical protein